MKRSPQLIPLSHEHHVALEAALRCDGRRRPISVTRSTGSPCSGTTWARTTSIARRRSSGRQRRPTTSCCRTACGGCRPSTDEIRALADTVLAGRADVSAARTLGERLNDHVRFEERELFPLIEARLDAAALDEVARALRA